MKVAVSRAVSLVVVIALSSSLLALMPTPASAKESPPAATESAPPTAAAGPAAGDTSSKPPSPPRQPDPPVDASAKRPVPTFDPAKAKLVERTRTSDVYENPDGTRTLKAFSGPANWKDSAGRWQAIDPSLVVDGERGFKNRSGEVNFAFAKKGDAAGLVTASRDGWSVSFGLEGAKDGGAPVTEGDKIRYPAVADGVDLQYTVTADMLKEVVVLERPLGPDAAGIFRFPLTLSGVTPRTEADGTIAFYDPAGTKVAVIPQGRMHDSSGDAAKGSEPAAAPVTTRLLREKGRWVVELAPDRAWLDDPARVYPVGVDPEFWAGLDSYAGDAFVGSGCGNCTYNGGGQWDGNYVDKIGYSVYNNGWWEWRTYAYYDVSPANGADILRADWYGYFYSTSQANATFVMRPASAGWNEWSVNWANQPGGCCDNVFGAANGGQWTSRDIRTWVYNWTHGLWTNVGIEIDNYWQSQYLRMGAYEANAERSFILMTYNTLANTPSNPSPASQWINTTTPTLCADYSDPNNDQGYLRFDIYNSSGTYVGVVTTPGWVPSGSRPCATVPAGWVGEGNMWYHAFAFDGYNWSSGYADVWLGIDTAPPGAPALSSSTHPSSSSWYPSGAFAASWPALSDASGIAGYGVSVTTNGAAEAPYTVTQTATSYSTTVGDGAWYLNVRAKDVAGNWGANARFAFFVDATSPAAPSIGVSPAPLACAMASWSTANSPTFSFLATDTSGINGYSYVFDQASGTVPDTTSEGTATTKSYSGLDGIWYFHARARNGAGLWGPAAQCAIRVDASAPANLAVSSSTHPNQASWYNNAAPALSWSASDTSGITGYSYVLDQAATTAPDTTSEGTATTKSFAGLADGVWYFHIQAQNGAGTWGPAVHFTVRVDATASSVPVVSSPTHPDQNAWYPNNTPVLNWSAADATSGIAGYSYVLDQSATTTPDSASEGTATTWTSPAKADGVWYFHVMAQNGAGTWSGPAHYTLRIDTGGPAAPVASSPTHPSTSTWYADANPSFTWTVPARVSPVTGYSWVLDQAAATDPDTTSDGTAPPANFTNVSPDGIWYFHVRARNAAGAWGPSGHREVKIDVTSPLAPGLVVSLTHPAGVGVSNRSATVTWTPGSDATSGVAGYSWSFNQDQTMAADAVSDGDALTLGATSASLPDSVSWFHVKSIDNAGNASADKVYGPIVVDPNGPLGLSLTLPSVAEAASDELGLEQFYPYARHDLGTADGYVQLRTGNLVVQHDDVDVPSQGLNVVVRRAYNSQETTDPDGMGRGWRLSVSDLDAGIEGVDGAVEALDASGLVVADLVDLVAGVATVTGQLVEFTDGDGTTHRFVRKGALGSRWESPPGVSLRLREVADGSGAVVAFELIRPDGVVYRAENVTGLLGLATTAWRVTSVTDRSANRLTYEYEAVAAGVGSKVRLVRIKHSRTADAVIVRFSYDAAAALVSVTSLPGLSAPDPATGDPRSWERRTDLAYTAGRLSSVTEAAHADVASGQRTTGFSYHPVTGLLETVADADGKLTSFGYTAEVGAQLLTTLTDRRAKPWGYAYGAADLAGARTTTASAPVGGATTYAISGRGPVSDTDRRVAGGNIAIITDAGTDAGAVVSEMSWAQNRLTATTDGAGATTSYTYNDLGLIKTVTQPAPNAPGTPGLPAGAPTVPVTSVLVYRFAAPWRYPGCTAPAPGPGPVSTEGYCEAVADLAQVRVADSAGDASRRVSDFTYDADTGHLITVTERADGSGTPAGADRTTAFAYYARGGLGSIDGPRTDEADITTFGDPGDPTYGGYDRTGMPLRLTDALDKTRTLAYTPYGLVANLVDRDEAVTTSRYDERDNLTEAKDAAGAITRFAYDANDAKVKETSPRGTATATVDDDHTTMWCHDATGLVVKVSEPGASGAAPAVDPCADVATRLADRTEALTSYRSDGTKASETNPAGAVVDFEYYPNASLKLTRADTTPGVARAETLHLYDQAGRVRLTRGPVASAAGERPETEWSFTPDGQVATEAATTAVTDAGGAVHSLVTYAYNAHGEPLEATGPRQVEGTRQRQAAVYNAFGEVTQSRRLLKAPGQAARDVVSRFGYDAAGHQTSASQPTGTGAELTSTFAFDAIGQLVAQTVDPLNPGHTVDYAYTGEGQQRSRVDKANGTALRTAAYAYNPDNTQASLVFTDNLTGATLASCNFAAGEPPASGFDPDGNLLVSRTVAGTAGCTGGTTTRSQTFAYDGRDFLTNTTQVLRAPAGNQVSRTQAFTYDPGGAHASATHAGKTTTYDHSPAGWLLAMEDWRGKASAVSYLPSGAPATHALGGAAKATMAYHRDGSLAELVWRKDSVPDPALLRAHTAVAYDTGGLRRAETVQVAQPVGETTGASAPGTAATDHDSLDRLVRWVSPFPQPTIAAQPATSYSLDDGGNIEAEAKTAGATSWNVDPSYDHGRLASRHSTGPEPTTDDVFSYTGLGEESSRATTTAGPIPTTATTATTYDPAGHTARVDQPGIAPDVDYVYDTADRLLARTEGLETTLYFYWGAGGTIAEETDAAGATKARYLVDDDDEVTAVERYDVPGAPEATARWTWQLSDLAGNAATFVDDAGAVVEQAAFDPYGKTERGGSGTDLVGGAKPTLGFQGAMTDKATGSVMLGARLYDPTTARFTTPDTYVASALDVGLGTDELTANRYLFAGANPVAFYEDGHGILGLKAPKLPSPIKALKAVAKKAMPVLQFVPVVSSGIDVVSAATGRDLANGGRKLSGAERAMLLATAAVGAVPGAGSAAKAGLKVTAKLTKAKSGAKVAGALARHADEAAAVCKNSFVPGTRVLMADGTTKAIENVDIGDIVKATDPTTGETAAKAVTDLIEGNGHKDLVAVGIDGHVVVATANHPFWVAGRGWVDAGDLEVGDRVLEADGGLEAVTGLRTYVVSSATVHNLSVAGLHTYYVMAGEPVLVHNCGVERRMTTVIGIRDDVRPFVGRDGFNTLGLTSWKWSKNRRWLKEAVSRDDEFLLATDPKRIAKYRGIAYRKELRYLKARGYSRFGEYMVRGNGQR